MRENTDKKPLISHAAIRDLDEIWDYIAGDSERAADHLIDEIVEKCRELAILKGVGHRREDLLPGLLSLAHRKYVVFFRRNERVEIVRILHGARDIPALFEEW
ncbi:MAG: type II toxin-antitoxin system RelE/ParE family toxin [Opitutales bacterium]|nr:type II toxin-antitoxin system RelE/ParE family toxin [Opitutales bacterium]